MERKQDADVDDVDRESLVKDIELIRQTLGSASTQTHSYSYLDNYNDQDTGKSSDDSEDELAIIKSPEYREGNSNEAYDTQHTSIEISSSESEDEILEVTSNKCTSPTVIPTDSNFSLDGVVTYKTSAISPLNKADESGQVPSSSFSKTLHTLNQDIPENTHKKTSPTHQQCDERNSTNSILTELQPAQNNRMFSQPNSFECSLDIHDHNVNIEETMVTSNAGVTNVEKETLLSAGDDDGEELSEQERCLKLNRKYQASIEAELGKIEKLIVENREQQFRLSQISSSSTNAEEQENKHLAYYANPYFKTKRKECPDDNEDTKLRKTLNQPHTFERPPKPWSEEEKTMLSDAVKSEVLEAKLTPLLQRVETINPKALKTKEDTSELEDLKKEIDRIKRLSLSALLENFSGDIDFEDVSNKVLHPRTPHQCQVFWYNEVHPFLNKGKWTKEEDKLLLKLTEENSSGGNWDSIARELKSNRSAAQCLRRYQRSLNKNFLKSKWEPEDDQKLVEAVKCCGIGPWEKVASFLDGRTGAQCMHRYLKSLDPQIKKGKWDKEEDDLLRKGVEMYGYNWMKIKNLLPRRTDAQIRERWRDVLDPRLRKDAWTKEEDEKLIKTVEEQSVELRNWSAIAKLMPGRTDNRCRRRWFVLMKNDPKTKEHLSKHKIRKEKLVNNFSRRRADKPDIGPEDFEVPHLSENEENTSTTQTPSAADEDSAAVEDNAFIDTMIEDSTPVPDNASMKGNASAVSADELAIKTKESTKSVSRTKKINSKSPKKAKVPKPDLTQIRKLRKTSKNKTKHESISSRGTKRLSTLQTAKTPSPSKRTRRSLPSQTTKTPSPSQTTKTCLTLQTTRAHSTLQLTTTPSASQTTKTPPSQTTKTPPSQTTMSSKTTKTVTTSKTTKTSLRSQTTKTSSSSQKTPLSSKTRKTVTTPKTTKTSSTSQKTPSSSRTTKASSASQTAKTSSVSQTTPASSQTTKTPSDSVKRARKGSPKKRRLTAPNPAVVSQASCLPNGMPIALLTQFSVLLQAFHVDVSGVLNNVHTQQGPTAPQPNSQSSAATTSVAQQIPAGTAMAQTPSYQSGVLIGRVVSDALNDNSNNHDHIITSNKQNASNTRVASGNVFPHAKEKKKQETEAQQERADSVSSIQGNEMSVSDNKNNDAIRLNTKRISRKRKRMNTQHTNAKMPNDEVNESQIEKNQTVERIETGDVLLSDKRHGLNHDVVVFPNSQSIQDQHSNVNTGKTFQRHDNSKLTSQMLNDKTCSTSNEQVEALPTRYPKRTKRGQQVDGNTHICSSANKAIDSTVSEPVSGPNEKEDNISSEHSYSMGNIPYLNVKRVIMSSDIRVPRVPAVPPLPPSATTLSAFKKLLTLRKDLQSQANRLKATEPFTNKAVNQDKNLNVQCTNGESTTSVQNSLSDRLLLVSSTKQTSHNDFCSTIPYQQLLNRFKGLFMWPGFLSIVNPQFGKKNEAPDEETMDISEKKRKRRRQTR